MTKICNYYVTLRCNDQCEFCMCWQNEDYKKIEEKPCDLTHLKGLGVTTINITGGEPLLRDDLPQILKEAKDTGFITQLTTNGILFAEKAQLINELVDKLFISLDYPMEKEHDRSRGVECFHQVIQAIKLAKDPIIQFTMTRDSVLYLPEMVDLAEKLKAKLYLSPVYDFYGTQGYARSTYDHIRYYAKRKNVMVNLAGLEFVKNNGNDPLSPRCRAKETTITILPDGSKAEPCLFNQSKREGREDICSSCMRWPYMLPSFSKGIDRYFWLNLYSEFLARRKGFIQ
jgi:MoaA/NifB/PqqE/SkfB family radical SAM enzyme